MQPCAHEGQSGATAVSMTTRNSLRAAPALFHAIRPHYQPWENSEMPSHAGKKLLKAAAQQPTYAAAAHSAASQPSHSWHIKNSRSTQGETRVALAAKTKFFLHSLCMALNAFLSLCILLVSAFNCLLLPIAMHCHVCRCLPQIVALWRRTDATLLYENRVKVKVIEPRAKPSSFGCDIVTLTKMILLE